MNKLMSKSAVLTMLLFGLLFLATAPDANAQERCRNRGRFVTSNYDNDSYNRRDYDRRDRYSRDFDRRSDRFSRDRYYYNDEDTTGRALRRTGIGAGVGALGGALLGGRKGAVIGAAIGAGGGYLYHRNKVGNQRDRFRFR